VTCTNLETGEPFYKKMNDMYAEIDYLRASASLPYVSRIVVLDGKKYLDGGVSDSVPIEAFQSMGYEKNVIVLTRPLEYRKSPEKSWLIKLFYRKYPKFVALLKNRHVKYNEEMDRINQMEQDGDIFVIRPSAPLNIGRLENDPEKIQVIYDAGYQDGLAAIEEMKKYLKE
jgi:predicted patatin/cPLA2 family phospholipase